MSGQPILTKNIIKAVFKGYQLVNAKLWKQLSMLLGVLISASPFLIIIFPQYSSILDPAVLTKLQAAIGGLMIYFTAATSEKVGL